MGNNELFDKFKKQVAVINFEQESYGKNADIYPLQKEWRKYEMKKKILQMVATIIAACACGITVYAGVNGNLSFKNMGLLKASENFDENKTGINKTIENDYVKIVVEDIACDSAYLILEYDIFLKEKAINEMGEIEYDNVFGYRLGFNNRVWINDQTPELSNLKTEKISENEYRALQVINIMNIDETELHLKVWINDFGIGKYYNEGSGVKINKMLEMDVALDANREIIGKEQQIDKNTKIVLEKVENSSFETFIRLKRISENVRWEDYKENGEYYRFNVASNNNTIQSNCYHIVRNIYKIQGTEEILVDNWLAVKDDEIVRVENTYALILGTQNNFDKLKIIHTKSTFFSDRTSEEREAYSKVKWYPVQEGEYKYSATNNKGGTFTINKVTIDDDYITFYFDKEGIFGNTSYVNIRVNDGSMNYVTPIKIEEKGLTSDENKIAFSRSTWGASGLNIKDGMLEDLNKLEFTLLYGDVDELIGEPLTVEIPEQTDYKARINNVQINDTKAEKYTYIKQVNVYDENTETTKTENREFDIEIDSFKNKLLSNRTGIDLGNEYRSFKETENVEKLKQEIESYFKEKNISYEIKELKNGEEI